jgi:uncharacterized protein YhaN/biotin operon repressor
VLDTSLTTELDRRRKHNAECERIDADVRRTRAAIAEATEALHLAEESVKQKTEAFAASFATYLPSFLQPVLHSGLESAESWVDLAQAVRSDALVARQSKVALASLEDQFQADKTRLQEVLETLTQEGITSLEALRLASPMDQLDGLQAAQDKANHALQMETAAVTKEKLVRDATEAHRRVHASWLERFPCWPGATPPAPGSDETRLFFERADLRLQQQDRLKTLETTASGGVERLQQRVQSRSEDDLKGAIEERSAALKAHEEGAQTNAANDLSAAEEAVRKVEGEQALVATTQDIEGRVADLLPKLDDVLALMGAIELLREAERQAQSHRMATKILERASQYLDQLTCGSLVAVELDDDADADADANSEAGRATLKVVQQGHDTRLSLDNLSEGARDQLWFALRLAFLEHHLELKRLPVILDDILVHFDDKRSAAALRALAEFAKHTQVLLFTHHPWVQDIATQENLTFTALTLPDAEVPPPETRTVATLNPAEPALRPVRRTRQAATGRTRGTGASNDNEPSEEVQAAAQSVWHLLESTAEQGPLSSEQICEHLGPGLARTVVRKAIKSLRDKGQVTAQGAGPGMRYELARRA